MIFNAWKRLLPNEFRRAFFVRCVVQFAKRQVNDRYIKKLVASGRPIFLELGAGPRKGIKGWITSDTCPGADCVIDLLKPFPFPDNSIDKIYSSHVLEHFLTSQLEFIMGECRRVLKPGGVLSASVPNAAIYIDAYYNPEAFNPEHFCRYKPGYRFYSKIDYLNYIAYMEGRHAHMFDKENLVGMLEANGFRQVRLRDFEPDLDLPARDYESIYVYAEK